MTSAEEKWTLQDKVALVTGASRGIGAETAKILAARGADLVINFRSKRARADEVAAAVTEMGRRALVVQADLTSGTDVDRMISGAHAAFGRIDLLVLNASGGLERDKGANYAMDINYTAQLRLVDSALPLMPHGSRIVFVTSHMAHFYGTRPSWPDYEPVARSKKACEEALLKRLPELTSRGIKLVIVSGDIIEGTITPKLLDRQSRGLIQARLDQVGYIPTVADFAAAIADGAEAADIASGNVIFVGSTEDYGA